MIVGKRRYKIWLVYILIPYIHIYWVYIYTTAIIIYMSYTLYGIANKIKSIEVGDRVNRDTREEDDMCQLTFSIKTKSEIYKTLL